MKEAGCDDAGMIINGGLTLDEGYMATRPEPGGKHCSTIRHLALLVPDYGPSATGDRPARERCQPEASGSSASWLSAVPPKRFQIRLESVGHRQYVEAGLDILQAVQ